MEPKFTVIYQDGDVKLEVRHYDHPHPPAYWLTAGVAALQLTSDGMNALHGIMNAYIDDGDDDE